MSTNTTPCAECGMPCTPGEFHPYAACLMFKGCHDSEKVRANLAALATPQAPAPAAAEPTIPMTEAELARLLAEAYAEGMQYAAKPSPPQPAEPECWMVYDPKGQRYVHYDSEADAKTLCDYLSENQAPRAAPYTYRPLYTASQPSPQEPAQAEDASLLDWLNANPTSVGYGMGYRGSPSGWWWKGANGEHNDAQSLRAAIYAARQEQQGSQK